MGVIIPQVVTEDRSSGALVVDGSLRFDSGKSQYLNRTLTTVGNRRTWTASFWFKKGKQGNWGGFLHAGDTDSQPADFIYQYSDDSWYIQSRTSGGSDEAIYQPTQVFRDTGWYHVVITVDTTQATESERQKIYINGQRVTNFASTNGYSQNYQTEINSTTYDHRIGRTFQIGTGTNAYIDGQFTQYYFIDGQALTPSYFGYTDPLTNTWRPKKFSGYFNQQVESYSSTLPILNTNSDGSSVTSGTRTDSNNATWILGLAMNTSANIYTDLSPSAGNATDYSNIVTSTNTSRFYGTSAYFNGTNAQLIVANSRFNFSSTNFTMETWIYVPTTPSESETVFASSNPDLFGSSSTAGVLVGWSSGNQLFVYVGSDSTPSIAASSTTTVSIKKWHHIAIAKSGSTITLYIDGIASGTTTTAVGNSTSGLYVAYQPGNARWFEAYYQDLRVYSSAKYTANFTPPVGSANSFYLPLDGNTPIGQDQSGRGNNWTPVNFGGSNTLEKATGALPILNTDGGGKVARVGVRTDAFSSNLRLAVPHAGVGTDMRKDITGSNNLMTSFSANNSTYAYPTDASGSPYSLALYVNGTGDYPRINFTAGDFNFMHNQDDSGTVEFWFYNGAYTTEGYLFANVGESSQVGLSLAMGSATTFNCYIQRGVSGGSQNAGTSTLPQNEWSHIAVTKQKVGSNVHLKVYVNGVNTASNTSITATDLSNSNSAQTYWQTGSSIGHEGSRGFTNAYISDIRIYNTVKYTQNFIPASTDPDILPDTPSGVSGSSKLTQITDGAVAFDGTGDYLRIAATSDFDQNPGTDFTAECFFYMTALSGASHIFGFQIDANNRTSLYFTDGTNTLNWWTNLAGSNGNRISASNVSINAWHHVAITRSGSTTTMWLDGISQGTSTTTDYPNGNQLLDIGTYNAGGFASDSFPGFISNVRVIKGTALYTSNFTPPTAPLTSVANTKLLCCKSNSSATASDTAPSLAAQLNAPLSSTPFADSSTNGKTITNPDSITTTSAGTNSFNLTTVASFNGSQRLTTTQTGMSFTGAWTIDTYIKIDSSASGYNAIINTGYNSGADKYVYIGIDDSDKPYLEDVGTTGTRTTASSAISKNTWYHIRVIQGDGSMKLYVNGTLYVSHTTNTFDMVTGGTFTIGSLLSGSNNANNFHGLMGPVRYVNGNLGAPAAGGEATSSGTLSNSPTGEAIGLSGNTAATNFNPFTANINAVRGQESGYATLNPLAVVGGVTYSNGNLKVTGSASYRSTPSTIAMSVGKWYVEYFFDTWANDSHVGVMNNISPSITGTWAGNTANGFAWAGDSGDLWTNGGYYNSSFDVSFTTGDTCQIAFDADNGNMYFGKNGVWLKGANPSAGTGANWTGLTNGPYYPYVTTTSGTICSANFGQKPFKFPPPAGFQPLALANTPRPTIVRPDQYVGVTTYNGNGGTQQITYGFQPDLIFGKPRNATVGGAWNWVDSVRGNKYLMSQSTNGEADFTGGNGVSFNSTGIAVIDTTNGDWGLNGNYGGTYVGNGGYVYYGFKAGGNSNTYNINDVGYATAEAAGLTAGTITPSGASVNTKSGFSIITYTGNETQGATVAHGLQKEPAFIIIKRRTGGTSNWLVGHKSLATNWGQVLYLNLPDGQFDQTAPFNDTAPTSSVWTMWDSSSNNASGSTYVAYLWAEIPGFSKFGSYVGNGSTTDGPMIVTGFRPRWILVKWYKDVSTAESWMIYDTARSPYNAANTVLYPDSSTQEESPADRYIDILSNGFKPRQNGQQMNRSGASYIYAAFAESPSFNLYGAQSNAR